MNLSLDFDGTAKLRGMLAQVRESGDDPRPAFHQVADYFEDQAEQVFLTRGRTAGGWKPLSAKYAKYRKAKPRGVQTGLLRRSMTTKGARYHRRLVSKTRVEVKSVAPHAHLYADGRGGQPARRLVRITRRNRRDIAGILQRHLTGGDR